MRRSAPPLEFHHRRRLDPSLFNCVVLCRECHRQAHQLDGIPSPLNALAIAQAWPLVRFLGNPV
jgi:hypothetical protein